MPKESKPEWKAITIEEKTLGSKVWRSQKLKSPDGKLMYSLRAFAKKANGDLVQTNQGFTIPKEDCDKELLEGLISLLKSMSPADKPKSGAKVSTATPSTTQFVFMKKGASKAPKFIRNIVDDSVVETKFHSKARLFTAARAKILEANPLVSSQWVKRKA